MKKTKRFCSWSLLTLMLTIAFYVSWWSVAEAKKLKIQGFIEKPFTSETLMASLAHLIEMREYRKQRRIHE